MTIEAAVKKVERAFGEKMGYTEENKQYFLNGLSFHDQGGQAINISVSGSFRDNIAQALKVFGKNNICG